MLFPGEGGVIPFKEVLRRQRLVLQGSDSNLNKFVPKVITECCKRLRVLLGKEAPEKAHFEDNVLINEEGERMEAQVDSPVKKFGDETESEVSIRGWRKNMEIGAGLVTDSERGPIVE